MSEKPEALRLADALTEAAGDYWQFHKSIGYGAAAELRRQHAENERIGPLAERVLELKAQRDALLEALKLADQFITNGMELGFIRMPDAATPDLAHETPGIVRAAIKSVEESK